MGYHDQNDFPNTIESFVRGIYPEDRDRVFRETNVGAFDEKIMSKTGHEFRFCRKDGSVRWYRSMQAGLNAHLSKPVEPDILFETLEGLIQN